MQSLYSQLFYREEPPSHQKNGHRVQFCQKFVRYYKQTRQSWPSTLIFLEELVGMKIYGVPELGAWPPPKIVQKFKLAKTKQKSNNGCTKAAIMTKL